METNLYPRDTTRSSGNVILYDYNWCWAMFTQLVVKSSNYAYTFFCNRKHINLHGIAGSKVKVVPTSPFRTGDGTSASAAMKHLWTK